MSFESIHRQERPSTRKAEVPYTAETWLTSTTQVELPGRVRHTQQRVLATALAPSLVLDHSSIPWAAAVARMLWVRVFFPSGCPIDWDAPVSDSVVCGYLWQPSKRVGFLFVAKAALAVASEP